jgi:hypothetical protein
MNILRNTTDVYKTFRHVPWFSIYMFIKGVHDVWLLNFVCGDGVFISLFCSLGGSISRNTGTLNVEMKSISIHGIAVWVTKQHVHLLWTCICYIKVHADMSCKRPLIFIIGHKVIIFFPEQKFCFRVYFVFSYKNVASKSFYKSKIHPFPLMLMQRNEFKL